MVKEISSPFCSTWLLSSGAQQHSNSTVAKGELTLNIGDQPWTSPGGTSLRSPCSTSCRRPSLVKPSWARPCNSYQTSSTSRASFSSLEKCLSQLKTCQPSGRAEDRQPIPAPVPYRLRRREGLAAGPPRSKWITACSDLWMFQKMHAQLRWPWLDCCRERHRFQVLLMRKIMHSVNGCYTERTGKQSPLRRANEICWIRFLPRLSWINSRELNTTLISCFKTNTDRIALARMCRTTAAGPGRLMQRSRDSLLLHFPSLHLPAQTARLRYLTPELFNHVMFTTFCR